MAENPRTPAEKKAPKKKNESGSLLKRLVADNRFIFACSVALAFVMWCLVSVYASPEVERTISNVPVSISLRDSTPEQLGLQLFGETEYYVDVVVKGPKYQVSENMFTVNDIRVTANTSYVDSAGETQLSLKAEIADASGDVEIVSLSRNTVTVYFDTLKEAVFPLNPDVRFPDGVEPVPDGYILDNSILSVSTVTVSGPATEVNKIKRVVARVENEASLTATTTSPAQIYMLTDTNASPSYCTCSAEDVTITMPVKKIVTLPVTVDFTHIPLKYQNSPLAVSFSPASVKVAMSTDVAETTQALSIGTIDFSDIKNAVNTFTFVTSEIPDVKFLDTDLKEITVKVDASSLSQKELTVTPKSVSTANLPSGYSVTYDLSDSYTVRAIGPEDSLEGLNATDIFAEVDFSGVELQTGRQQVKLFFVAKTTDDCWCYGEYTIDAVITQNQTTTTGQTG